MSDDDTAKDKANNDAESTEKVDAAQDSTAADATVKFESDSSVAAAKGADTAKTADAAKAADADETVKLRTAAPAPASAPSSGKSTPWVPIVAAFAAGVLLVAAVTAVVVFYLKADNREDQLSARDDSTKAACDFGKAVASYDSKDLDAYFKSVNDLSTGEWGKFFSGASDTLKQAMVSVQAKSKLDEIHCAWESGNDSQANVVLVITQEQTNQAVPQPDKLTIPGVAQMEKHDGKWLVAKFDSPVTKGMGPSGPAPGAPQAAPGTSPQANGGAQPAPAPQPGN
jgi:Mce-associated membrane protein